MIWVSGSSDDLVEIEGDWEDEIGCYGGVVEIGFDDGTQLEMKYSDQGTWKAKVLKKGKADSKIEKLVENDDYYSDLFTIDTGGVVSLKGRPGR